MALERASVAQHIQVGVESVPGTAVAASKQLRSIGIAPSPKMTVNQFRPDGQKYVSIAIEGQEWVEASMTGAAVYDELVYPLSSLLGAATVTQLTAAPTLPTLTTALTLGTPASTLAVTALPVAVNIGDNIQLVSGANVQNVVATSAAAISATSITVATFTPNFSYPIGTTVNDTSFWRGAFKWAFTPQAGSADTPKTYTVQHGDPATRADQFSYGLVTEMQFNIDRQKFELSGNMLGQRLTDGITMTANPTLLPLVPINPATLNVFSDSSFGGIGTTRLGRVLTANWHLANKQGPVWTLDSTQNSWAASVELVPTLTATLLMEADVNGMAFLNNVRNGSTQYVRISSAGANIGQTTNPYSFTLDLPVQVINTQGFSDHNGVYAIQWEFACVYDTTAQMAMALTLQNSLAAL